MDQTTKNNVNEKAGVIGNPRRAFTDILRTFGDAELRGLLFFVAILLLVGVVFYMTVEGWDFVESLYFSVATLTTVGYGDLYPTNDVSRLFTAAYVLIGIGFILSMVMTLARLANKPVVKRINGHVPDKKKDA